jgi:hypothetical protein
MNASYQKTTADFASLQASIDDVKQSVDEATNSIGSISANVTSVTTIVNRVDSAFSSGLGGLATELMPVARPAAIGLGIYVLVLLLTFLCSLVAVVMLFRANSKLKHILSTVSPQAIAAPKPKLGPK